MSLDALTAALRDKAAAHPPLGYTVKFNFGDDGIIHLDGTGATAAVSNDDKAADCTISLSLADFAAMTSGDLDATTAFMMGKLKIDGSMGVALKLQGILS
jgi:putative sterol carrier protein